MTVIAAKTHSDNAAKLGLILFIATEIMFFSGLISAFLVFKMSPGVWPPAGQPRLPIAVTGINTLILILSAFTFQIAFKNMKTGDEKKYITSLKWLEITAPLGLIFLIVQGSEWIHLIRFGLTMGSGIYGGFFYLLVGLHGVHVLIALIALTLVKYKANHGFYFHNTLGVELCRMYWFFVVGLWPILYILIYT